jgi:hypothetical protein
MFALLRMVGLLGSYLTARGAFWVDPMQWFAHGMVE